MRKLDFTTVDQSEDQNKKAERRTRRWKRREANPVVQMSVRMHEEVYERFRDLCEEERYTNGEMLEILLTDYLTRKNKSG